MKKFARLAVPMFVALGAAFISTGCDKKEAKAPAPQPSGTQVTEETTQLPAGATGEPPTTGTTPAPPPPPDLPTAEPVPPTSSGGSETPPPSPPPADSGGTEAPGEAPPPAG